MADWTASGTAQFVRFSLNGKEQYGIIKQFYMIDSTPVVVIKPLSPSGSLLQTVGVPGRQVLQEYASMDLLGAFIIQVEHSQTLSLN